MLVHKGGKIKNMGVECRDVTPTKLQSQNIFKEHRGIRMDVNEELKFFYENSKKMRGGGGRGGVGSEVGLGVSR